MLSTTETDRLEEMLRAAADNNRFIQIEYALNVFHAFLVDRKKRKEQEERDAQKNQQNYLRRQHDANRFAKEGKLYNGKSARQMLKEK